MLLLGERQQELELVDHFLSLHHSGASGPARFPILLRRLALRPCQIDADQW
jgi:hypothetical protein